MLGPYLLGERGPGAWRGTPGGGNGGGESDPGFPEPPIVTDINGDVTIHGKVKPGSFGKFVYPLATVAANRQYTFRAVANFSQLAKQGKLAMVGFGFKNGNDFHIDGLRGDGSTGTNEYIVHGTPPNGWNKQTGHTEVDNGAAGAGTQHSAYYRLVTSADGATYTLKTSTDGVAYTTVVTGQALTPFSNISGVATFGVALWFNNSDAGPFTITITAFADEAGATWEPDQLGSALKGWFKGNELAGANNDPIANWPDDSGNGNDMTNGSAPPRPLLATSLLNSMNVVRFVNASNHFLQIDLDTFSGATAASAYVVFKVDADPPVSTGGLWRVGTGFANLHPHTDGVIYDGFGATVRKTTGDPTPALTSWRIYGVHSAANDWGSFIDGVSFFSTATNTVGFEPTGPSFGRGDDGAGSTVTLQGHVAEVIFTNAKQSQANREKVEGYLAHKWGLTGNLDAGHPYKSSPPTI